MKIIWHTFSTSYIGALQIMTVLKTSNNMLIFMSYVIDLLGCDVLIQLRNYTTK